MKADDAREMTDAALEILRVSLEGGKSDALVAFLKAAARFHKYSWGNLLLIMAQRPDATRVAGFHKWRSFGRAVKKGEKGIGILAPIIIRNREETPEAEAQSEVRRDRKLWFKVAYVFDVTQTEGEELAALRHADGDPAHFAERLRNVVSDRGIRLEFGGIVGAAYGTSSGGLIRIREGLAPAEEFSTLAHELAHEMLHHGADAERGNKTTVETEAEAVAFVVATAVGLDAAGASSDYIQLYRGDAKTLAGSLDRIQRTASGIVAQLLAEAG